MARMNANLGGHGTGRLVDHPIFTTLSNGAKSAWIRVAFDRSEIDPTTKRPKVDIIPFQMYIAPERDGKMPMFWAYKGSRVTLTFAPRSFMKTTPEGNRSDFALEIDDIEVLDSAAETNARLQGYAAKGDQVAVAALAARTQNTGAPTQGVQDQQVQAQPQRNDSLPASIPAQPQVQAQPQQAPADILADVPWLNQGANTVAPEWAQD